MAISKKIRLQVYEKYGGLCGYTGKPLGDKWEVDHVTPQSHYRWYQSSETMKCDDIANLIPAIKIINHYKRGRDLEQFRRYISTLHIRLKKLPKKTMVARTENRKRYLLEVAEHFGVTPDNPFNGTFYFETIPLLPVTAEGSAGANNFLKRDVA